MSIDRYILHSDNAPGWGYATVSDIQGTGIFHLDMNWTIAPQNGIITFAQTFNLPHEFIPTSDASLLYLEQSEPNSRFYDAKLYDTPGGGSVTTISALKRITIVSPTNMEMIHSSAWYLLSSGSLDVPANYNEISQPTATETVRIRIFIADSSSPLSGKTSLAYSDMTVSYSKYGESTFTAFPSFGTNNWDEIGYGWYDLIIRGSEAAEAELLDTNGVLLLNLSSSGAVTTDIGCLVSGNSEEEPVI